MALTVDAVYENGVLRPTAPLPFTEHEQVTVTVESRLSWAERTAGMLKWTGACDVLERLAIDPAFDPQES